MIWKVLRFWFYRLCIVDCVGCGSLVVHARGLCLCCESHVLKNFLSSQAEATTLESGLRFRFLFHWIPGDDKLISKYVYLLKSPLAEPLWDELSRYFVKPKNHGPGTVFIPVPSRKNRQHSLYFARGLAAYFGGHAIPALSSVKGDLIEQKKKSRAERRKIQFVLNEEFTELLRLAPTIVLVDDVITTGASYEAAYSVLKSLGVCPENTELWTAFYRETRKLGFE